MRWEREAKQEGWYGAKVRGEFSMSLLHVGNGTGSAMQVNESVRRVAALSVMQCTDGT